MKNLKERVADISSYLQSLTDPAVLPKVQNAVEKKDKDKLVRICRRAKVPEIYMGNIVSLLLSAQPQQKWPEVW
jgi:hypothetical protein